MHAIDRIQKSTKVTFDSCLSKLHDKLKVIWLSIIKYAGKQKIHPVRCNLRSKSKQMKIIYDDRLTVKEWQNIFNFYLRQLGQFQIWTHNSLVTIKTEEDEMIGVNMKKAACTSNNNCQWNNPMENVCAT